MEIDHDPNEVREPWGPWLSGLALLLMGLFFAGLHWLYTGISADFGSGLAAGALIAMGLMFLASRRLRELP